MGDGRGAATSSMNERSEAEEMWEAGSEEGGEKEMKGNNGREGGKTCREERWK